MGVAAGGLAVVVVTAAIELVDNFIPVLSLGVLYLFAVLPVALFWGTMVAVPVAVASMLAFNFFFLPPLYTFTLADRQNWSALAVYVVTAVVVGGIASRYRTRGAEAEQREREAALPPTSRPSCSAGRSSTRSSIASQNGPLQSSTCPR